MDMGDSSLCSHRVFAFAPDLALFLSCWRKTSCQELERADHWDHCWAPFHNQDQAPLLVSLVRSLKLVSLENLLKHDFRYCVGNQLVVVSAPVDRRYANQRVRPLGLLELLALSMALRQMSAGPVMVRMTLDVLVSVRVVVESFHEVVARHLSFLL